MTEAEWNACTDPQKMLEFLRGKASDRKLRLFAVSCCRRIWQWMPDEPNQKVVAVAERSERFADNQESELNLTEAQRSSGPDGNRRGSIRFANWAAAWTVAWNPRDPQGRFSDGQSSASAAADRSSFFAVRAFVADARRVSSRISQRTRQAMLDASAVEKRSQARLLHCIFGPLPFRSIALDPTWLTPTVKQLAEAIYQERAFDRLPVLADALEDAGCNNADILGHLRSGGEHCRGCWPVDLVTGKE